MVTGIKIIYTDKFKDEPTSYRAIKNIRERYLKDFFYEERLEKIKISAIQEPYKGWDYDIARFEKDNVLILGYYIRIKTQLESYKEISEEFKKEVSKFLKELSWKNEQTKDKTTKIHLYIENIAIHNKLLNYIRLSLPQNLIIDTVNIGLHQDNITKIVTDREDLIFLRSEKLLHKEDSIIIGRPEKEKFLEDMSDSYIFSTCEEMGIDNKQKDYKKIIGKIKIPTMWNNRRNKTVYIDIDEIKNNIK